LLHYAGYKLAHGDLEELTPLQEIAIAQMIGIIKQAESGKAPSVKETYTPEELAQKFSKGISKTKYFIEPVPEGTTWQNFKPVKKE
jgi:hypothetical protein